MNRSNAEIPDELAADESPTGVDPDTFRNGMSRIPTVVTVVTVPVTTDGAGGGTSLPCGVTIGSFASLSLEPPLVSYNLTTNAAIHPLAVEAEHFAVHVLTDKQADLSDRFAHPHLGADDQLDGLDVTFDERGVPLFRPFLVRFHCRLHSVQDGGDHSIITGLVEQIEESDGWPLIYYDRSYRSLS